MIRNLNAAAHDDHVRDRHVALLVDRVDDSDSLDPDAQAELRGWIRNKPGQMIVATASTTGAGGGVKLVGA